MPPDRCWISFAISCPWRARSSRSESTSISALPFLSAASAWLVRPICMIHTYHRRGRAGMVGHPGNPAAGLPVQGPSGHGRSGGRKEGCMRWILACALSAIVVGPAMHEQAVTAGLDPAGKWTFSTRDDQGQSIGGIMTIAGTPGHYSGTIVVKGQERQPVITDVLAAGN